ncbi:MAG: response regulator, partial [Planctomycetota bacterium]
LLEENGYAFKIAGNGKEGLEALQTEKPALVLLDIMMPKKSGISVLKEMKKNPEFQGIPVIIITGSTEVTGVDMKTGETRSAETEGDVVGQVFGDAIREKLGDLKPDGLVEKPIDPDLLVSKIKELLV